jgi:hypothetical protein
MGETFTTYSSDKRLISRIYKQLQKLSSKIIIQLINEQMSSIDRFKNRSTN